MSDHFNMPSHGAPNSPFGPLHGEIVSSHDTAMSLVTEALGHTTATLEKQAKALRHVTYALLAAAIALLGMTITLLAHTTR